MSFSESDYPALMDSLDALITEVQEPLMTLLVLREAIRLARRLPLYPGIAAGLARSLLQDATAGELAAGDQITWTEPAGVMSGEVVRLTPSEVLVEPLLGGAGPPHWIGREMRVRRLDRLVLERTWPTLVFDEAQP